MVWVQTPLRKSSEWEMMIRHLSYVFRYSSSHTHASKSKWFVGSSSKRMCGWDHVALQNATRLFWPPESVRMRCVCHCPDIPNLPIRRRT
mmetsp:Transcript_14730/g.26047  ORF Transcript_14730/g.26047 Transcript_14730/m.26047 type:complete len:90 (+) Transcript_14730:1206-1475(+)